jgi:hypothetical protein
LNSHNYGIFRSSEKLTEFFSFCQGFHAALLLSFSRNYLLPSTYLFPNKIMVKGFIDSTANYIIAGEPELIAAAERLARS